MITGLSWLLFVLAASTHAEPASPSLTLDQAVTLALEQNQGLKALRGRVEEGKGELLLAETFPFNPVLKLDAVTDRPFAGEGEDRYGIALEQELQIAGQRGLRTDIAANRLVGIVRLTQDGERKLVRDVKLAFYEIIFLQEALKVRQEIVQVNRRLVEVARNRARLGDAPELDTSLAVVELRKAQQARIITETQLANAKKKLNTLLGRSPDREFRIDEGLQSERRAYEELELLAYALSHRPDLAVLHFEQAAFKTATKLARRERIPNVTARLGVERERSAFSDTPIGELRDTDNLFSFQLSVPLPFINRRQGEIARAAAREKIVATRLAGLDLSIRQEVAVALQRAEATGEGLELFDRGIIPQAKDNFERIQQAYRLGQIDILQLLAVQDRFVKTRLEGLSALLEYNRALAELESVVGLGGPVAAK